MSHAASERCCPRAAGGRPLSALILLVGLAAWNLGCKSTTPPDVKAAAAVVIEGASVPEIRRAAITVFLKEGYDLRESFDRDVMFEKRAGRMSDVVYGGWLSHQTWVRVKLHIENHGPGARLLTCNEYVVRGRGDSVFEEERKPLTRQRGYYYRLIDEIRLRSQSPSGSSPGE